MLLPDAKSSGQAHEKVLQFLGGMVTKWCVLAAEKGP
jgi:hypothetical protein